jgi:hypothetical protein
MTDDKTLLDYVDEEIRLVEEELRQAKYDLEIVKRHFADGIKPYAVYLEQTNAIVKEIRYLKERLARMYELRRRLTQK